MAIPLSASAGDEAFVTALRQRGLQRLAETWCRRELQSTDDDRRTAKLVGLLSQIEVDRALAAAPADRDLHWRAAANTIDQFLSTGPEKPAWLLLQLQKALNIQARGEAEQLESAARGQTTATEAARSLRVAAQQLAAVADKIEAHRQRIASRDASAPFGERELASLANRVALAQAETWRQLAACHPADSPDRDDALLQASQLSRQLAAQSLPADILWQARLLTIECERLLGNAKVATTQMSEWNDAAPLVPPALAGRLAAERLRLLNRVDAGTPRHLPELDLAMLERGVERLNQEESSSAKAEQAAKIQAAVVQIRAAHGGLWGLRAEAIAGAALAEPAEGGSTDALVARAEYLYRAGRFDEAVDAYDKAAAMSYQRGARGRSFELALSAAAIRQLRKQWTDAAERFRRAALANATHPQAPIAHRTSALCLSKALRELPEPPSDLWEAYFELLEEHLASWPEAESAGELRWWLIEPLLARGAATKAIDVLSNVPPDDSRHAEAVRLLSKAWLHSIQSQVANRKAPDLQRLLARATTQLQQIITGVENQWPSLWSPAQREAAIGVAQLRLKFDATESGAGYVEKVLQAAQKGPPVAEAGWLQRASPLLAAALVRQDKIDSARELLRERPPRVKANAKLLLDELLKRQEQGNPGRTDAGEFTLAVLESLGEGGSQAWSLPYRAAALAATGRGGDALTTARQLAEGQPDNPAAQRQLAQLLSQQPAEAPRREALALWQTIERRSGKSTDAWREARLARIHLLSALGESDKADKLLRITRVLHPDWELDASR